MKANWVKLPRGDIMPQYAGIYVTMNPAGEIILSKSTFRRLGSPKGFVIYFDTVNSRIALHPSNALTSDAYPTTASNNAGARRVRACRLLREYSIQLPYTMRFYDAEINTEGYLVLDLRTAKPCPRAAARTKRTTADSAK